MKSNISIHHYWYDNHARCDGVGGDFAPEQGSWKGVTCKKCLRIKKRALTNRHQTLG